MNDPHPGKARYQTESYKASKNAMPKRKKKYGLRRDKKSAILPEKNGKSEEETWK